MLSLPLGHSQKAQIDDREVIDLSVLSRSSTLNRRMIGFIVTTNEGKGEALNFDDPGERKL
jgi:hypothetical protein